MVAIPYCRIAVNVRGIDRLYRGERFGPFYISLVLMIVQYCPNIFLESASKPYNIGNNKLFSISSRSSDAALKKLIDSAADFQHLDTTPHNLHS